MTLYVLVNYRDPKNKKKIANPVVDIAASGQVKRFAWLVGELGLGCILTDKHLIRL